MPPRVGGFARRNQARKKARRGSRALPSTAGSRAANIANVRMRLGMGAPKRRKRGGVRKKRNMKGVATDGNKSKIPTIEHDVGSVMIPSTIRFQYNNKSAPDGERYIMIIWTPSNLRAFEMGRNPLSTQGNIDAVWKATSILDADPPQSIRPGRLSVTIRNISTAQTCNGLIRVLISPNTFDWVPAAANGTAPCKWGFTKVSDALEVAFGKNPDVRTFTAQEMYASKTFTVPILSKQAYSTFLNYNPCPKAMDAVLAEITTPPTQGTDALPVSDEQRFLNYVNAGNLPGIWVLPMTLAQVALIPDYATLFAAFKIAFPNTAVVTTANYQATDALPVTLTRGQDLGALGMIVVQLPQQGAGQTPQTYDFCIRSHDVCRYPLSSTMAALHEKQNAANEAYMKSYVQGVEDANMNA